MLLVARRVAFVGKMRCPASAPTYGLVTSISGSGFGRSTPV